jgi:exo-beta-1,3-glucanase (GH17 family)
MDVTTAIKPDGMNFLFFTYRTPKTSASSPRRIGAMGTCGITFVAHKASGTAKMTEVIKEILLPAFRKPIKPPARSRTM